MIVALHHAQLTVPKGAEVEAKRFFCEQLGLREIPKPSALVARGGFWLEVAGLQIHVGTEDGVDRQKTKAHLGFEVDDLGTMRSGEKIPGLDRFEFRDPFGNRMEFVQRV